MSGRTCLLIPAEEYTEMEATIERLEKALDKACTELSIGFHGYDDATNVMAMIYTTEDWKEWCMSDGS